MTPQRAPDAGLHRPDPDYLRALLEAAGLSQRECARRLGVAERQFRQYLTGKTAAPYVVQYALESLTVPSSGRSEA